MTQGLNNLVRRATDAKYRRRMRRLDEAIRAVMATKDGRRVFRWLREIAHLDDYLTRGDTLEYQAGMRNTGMVVVRKFTDVAPELVALARDESDDEAEEQ